MLSLFYQVEAQGAPILCTMDYEDFVHLIRKVGTCLTFSDFSKYALGFIQLASMCELAIVIHFSVYHT